jgi:long-chain acyl-CoA synthetase
MTTVNSAGGIKKSLFDTAFEAKAEGLKEGYLTHAVWDPIVFSSIKAKLGRRVRFMISGAAPLSVTVHQMLRVCFGIPVIEGYGQTEATAALTAGQMWDVKTTGHVGFPIGNTEIKLVDVPQMDYLSTDKPYPRGEVCYRGPSACKGYFKSPDKTKELIDDNGWYHTGDVGQIDEIGRLKIIDRAKNIFKLSLGEYIAPEKLETVFAQSSFVLQNWVYGDSLKSRLVAVVHPNFENLTPWAKAKGHKDADKPAELVKDPAIIKTILDDMNDAGKKNKIRGFESLAAIYLSPEPFSVANDTLTPTFKLRRPQLKKMFQKQLDELYKDLD